MITAQQQYERKNPSFISIDSCFFRRRGDSSLYILILKRHNNKLFVGIIESDVSPDSLTGNIAETVLDFVMRKYDDKQTHMEEVGAACVREIFGEAYAFVR